MRFPELEKLVRKMKAPISDWAIGTGAERSRVFAELGKGVEISNLEKVKAGPGGLLMYKDVQAILYIKDTQAPEWRLQHRPEDSRRYHLAECRTIRQSRRNKRFERYVLTNRSDGKFLADAYNPVTGRKNTIEAELKVCKNCLGHINYNGYRRSDDREKNKIWREFDLAYFLREYSTFFCAHPSRRDRTAPLDIYPKDWHRISKKQKLAVNYTCDICGVCLNSHQRLIHTHHISGVKTNNFRSNLQVLCVECHSRQPQHNIKVTLSEKNIIQEEKIKQGFLY